MNTTLIERRTREQQDAGRSAADSWPSRLEDEGAPTLVDPSGFNSTREVTLAAVDFDDAGEMAVYLERDEAAS